MLFNTNRTFFQHIAHNEAAEFVQKSNISELALDNSFSSEGIIYSVKSNSNALKNLLTNDWNISTDPSQNKYTSYLKDVSMSIIKPDGIYTIQEALSEIIDIHSKLGTMLAGVLLVRDKMILNPLHPVTALELLDQNLNANIFKKFKMVIYTYKNRSELDSIYLSSIAHSEKIKTNINAIISLTTSKVADRKIISDDIDATNTRILQTYRISREKDEDSEYDYYVIPNQILTKGIVVPYYGTSVVKTNGSASHGVNISPFLSANIVHTWRNNEDSTPLAFNSVCTGSLSNKTISGMRTLNHSNLSSPYNESCILNGALPYADACIEAAVNLYAISGVLNETQEDSPF